MIKTFAAILAIARLPVPEIFHMIELRYFNPPGFLLLLHGCELEPEKAQGWIAYRQMRKARK